MKPDNYDYRWADKIIGTNFLGVIYWIDKILPKLLNKKSGVIAATSSLSDNRGYSGSGFYCASKAALSNYQIHNVLHKQDMTKADMEKFFTIELRDLVRANEGRRGFTYTHKPVLKSRRVADEITAVNRRAIKAANKKLVWWNFTEFLALLYPAEDAAWSSVSLGGGTSVDKSSGSSQGGRSNNWQ